MKYSLLLLSFVSLLFLSGCNFDESLERNQQKDGDDINILQDIGPQALDQMFQGRAAVAASQASRPVVQSPSTKILEEGNSGLKDPYEGENEYEGRDD